MSRSEKVWKVGRQEMHLFGEDYEANWKKITSLIIDHKMVETCHQNT